MKQVDGQISMFEILEKEQDWFKAALIENLKRGSGFEGGKLRIFAAALILDKDRLADFLQNEYNVGGNSIEGGFQDYNFRGITIQRWGDKQEKRFPWSSVRDEVRKLVADGEYLTEKEWKRIQTIAANHGGELPRPTPRMRYE